MNDTDLDSLTGQIRENCDISDSRHAGTYSVCGLALRLRDLYKWHMGLEPWMERSSSEILDWIGEREERWNDLAEREFGKITIGGDSYDPFETESINAALEPHLLFYGAGYARSVKPTFFLAGITGKKEVNGHVVYVLGRELARDLFTTPALSQAGCVVIRQESAKSFLWEKIHYVNESGRPALKFALESYGIKDERLDALHLHLEEIALMETETYIHHELGEVCDTIFDRDLWREIIGEFAHSRIELLARTVKDLLADTNEHGTLAHIARERKSASLAFYVAFLDTFTKKVFPEMTEAFREHVRTHDWGVVEEAADAGFDTARLYAETIMNIYRGGREDKRKDWVEKEISKSLLMPLGV